VDAQAYCRWAKLALPSEAEWEKAARGGDGRKWPWGNDWDPGNRCNFADQSCPADFIVTDNATGKTLAQEMKERGGQWDREHDDGYSFTAPVGSFPKGASPCGALDMAGNVWQWCEDWFDAQAYARYGQGDFSPPPTGTMRVARGGSWQDDARGCQCATRGKNLTTAKQETMGFRVVLRANP
jgi:formylglycine-generating enzyme required for sulfatase activity